MAPESMPDDERTVPAMPSAQEALQAKQTSRQLAAHFQGHQPVSVTVLGDKDQPSEPISLPASAVRLLIDVLELMAQGNAVTIMPINTELTTQEAADILNVSRPYLIKLLDSEKIAFKLVGRHRRIIAKDLFRYKREMDKARSKTFNDMVAYDQELGFL